MKEKQYDEDEVLTMYLINNAQRFMTDFERQCVWLGITREKSEASESEGIAKRLRERYDAEATEEIDEALSVGVWEYQQQIQRRLRREYDEGTLKIKRCPKCSRIVRTPLAQQCLWCGHDWHDSRMPPDQ